MSNNNPLQQRIHAESFRHFVKHTFGRKNFGWYTVLYTALFILAGGWFPDGIADFFKYLAGDRSLWCINYQLIVSSLILIFFGIQLAGIINTEKIEVKSALSEPVKILGIFLSPLVFFSGDSDYRKIIVEGNEKESLENVLFAHSLKREALDGTSWEMPLRAVDFHKSRLERLSLFTSSGNNGTSAVSELFIKFLNLLYPEILVVEKVPGGLDFENIKEIFTAIEKFYVDAVNDGYKESDVLVDITGGKKTNSIAASIASLASGRKFQYIGDDKMVRSFDVGYFEGDES